MGFFDDIIGGVQGFVGGSGGNILETIVSAPTNLVGTALNTVGGLIPGGAGGIIGAITSGSGMQGMQGSPGAIGVAGGVGVAGARAAAGWIWKRVGFGSFKEFAKYAAGAAGLTLLTDAIFGDEERPVIKAGKGITMTSVTRVYENGFIEQVSVEEGHPILMSRDYQKARRVQRTVSKMHARIPRRTVKQSMASKAKEALEQQIIDAATCPPPRGKGCC